MSTEEEINIIDYKKFNFDDLTFDAPIKTKNGSHIAFAKYDSQNVFIQTPRLKCNQIIKTDIRCALELEFDKSHGEFYEYITSIDDYSIIQIQKNSKQWFGKKIPLDIVEEFYKTPVKVARKNKPPSFKIKVPLSKGLPMCVIYNKLNKEIEFNRIKCGTKTLCVLKFIGLKFLKQQVICEWLPIQIKSYEITPPIKNKIYLIKDNLLTDDERHELTKSSESTESVQEVTTELVQEESLESVQEVTTEPVQEESLEPVQEDTTEPVQEDTTELVQEESLEPVQEVTTELVQEVTTEPVQEESLESVQEDTTEPVQEESLESVQEDTTEPVQEESLESVQEVTTEPVQEVTTEPVQEVTTEPFQEVTTEPFLYNDNIDNLPNDNKDNENENNGDIELDSNIDYNSNIDSNEYDLDINMTDNDLSEVDILSMGDSETNVDIEPFEIDQSKEIVNLKYIVNEQNQKINKLQDYLEKILNTN